MTIYTDRFYFPVDDGTCDNPGDASFFRRDMGDETVAWVVDRATGVCYVGDADEYLAYHVAAFLGCSRYEEIELTDDPS
jgi:hypothetical protein